MKRYMVFLFMTSFLFSFISCSDDDLSYFQNNDPEPEYNLFTILDDYPALRSAFSPIDQRKFNELLENSINGNLKETKDVLALVDDLLTDPGRPVTEMITYFRNVLYNIENQDRHDRDSFSKNKQPPGDPNKHALNFYGFYDKISEADISLAEDILPIARKVVTYFNDIFKGEELEETISELIVYLGDDETYLWRDNEDQLFEDLSKLLFQANENIWLDKDRHVITDRSRIAEEGVTDTGVGNAVRGMDALLSAISEILSNDAIRNIIYDIVRDAGNIFAASVNGNDLKGVIKGTFRNARSFITPGGEEYEKWEEYIWPEFNPYSGYGNENGVKIDNKHRVSTNCAVNELTNDLLMGCFRLCLRSDRDGSILNDKEGEKIYLFDLIARNVRRMGYNPDNPNSCASHAEEGFYDLLRFDEYGRDRVVDHYDPDNYDPSTEPFPQSSLDHILFVAINGTTLGWTDGPTDLMKSPSPNEDHAPRELSGNLSLSNIFTTLGTNRLLGLNFYEMAFDITNGDNLFRRRDYFNPADKEKFNFYYDENLPFFTLLSGNVTSDYGIKEGGNLDGNPPGATREELLNHYMPYDCLGIGNTDLAGWLLGKLARCAWRGEGPYYSTEGMKQEGNVYTYYSPNGNIYTKITKPDPEDSSTWEYLYPVGDKDVPGKALFLSDIDLIPHDDFTGVELEENAVINIIIDDTSLNVTFEAGVWNQYAVMDKLNDEINNVFGFNADDPDLVWPGGRGIRINGISETPADGKIIISDVSGNGVSMLFRSSGGTIKEYAGRQNRYYGRWPTDYFLASYTPLGSMKKNYCVGEDVSGNATRPNNVIVEELIPERCVDRECATFEEAIFRNWQWFLTDMKLYFAIPLYLKIGGKAVKELVTFLFKNSSWEWAGKLFNSYIPDTGVINLPAYLVIEGVGGVMLMGIRIIPSEEGKPGWNRWGKNGGYGASEIPGDWRIDVRLPELLVARWLQDLIEMPLNMAMGMGLHKTAMTLVWDGLLGIPPLLQNSRPIPPAVGHSLPSLSRLAFLRSQTELVYPEGSPHLNYGDKVIGSRKGALRTRPEYGFEANDDDPNWRLRNSFMPLLVMILVALHEYTEFDYNVFDPLEAGSGIVKNSMQCILESLFAMLSKPPSQYFEKDYIHNGDPYNIESCLYPHNAFKARIFGGALKEGHPYGERYYKKGENGKPDTSAFFYTRTCDVAGTDPLSTFGGWQERNFYRMADNRDLISILSDTDPYIKNPKRCDGLMPILFHYDVSKDTNDPGNVTNTRVLSNVMRLLYTLGGPEFDDPPGYDDEDSSTWGTRRKFFYGVEQYFTTVKLAKGPFTVVNETNYKKIVAPEWMFYKDGDGKSLPVRPEDVFYKAYGWPQIPEDGPEEGDWSNCFTFIDVLADLLSDNGPNHGKYNIVENLISLLDKIFRDVDINFKDMSGLRSTIGAMLTIFNDKEGSWEYPDDLVHILEKQLPEILSIYRGHFRSLLILADALLKPDKNGENFLLYLMKNLKSEYPTRDVLEQLHDFLGLDLVKYPDSALWTDLTELLISFVDMIEEEQPGWLEDDAFLSNKSADNMDPFGSMGELLSW